MYLVVLILFDQFCFETPKLFNEQLTMDELPDGVSASMACRSQAPFSSFVLMVEPALFFCNRETAKDNKCQPQSCLEEASFHSDDGPSTAVSKESASALSEHRSVARRLKEEFAVDVHVVQACAVEQATKPDAIFPNNSVSFHSRRSEEPASVTDEEARSRVVLYPMSPGRRDEIPPSLMNAIQGASTTTGYRVVDLRPHEQVGLAMEGTGAVTFSVDGSAMFVGISQRASAALIPSLRDLFDISPHRVFVFHATDENGDTVYHTNVVGWVGSGICAWCFESMHFDASTPDEEEAPRLRMMRFMIEDICNGVEDRVLHLTRKQMRSFAGNCLEVQRSVKQTDGRDIVVPLLCMSETAWSAFSDEQQAVLLEHYGGTENIARFAIPTIERLGGGSVRCLLAASIPLVPRTEEHCRLPSAGVHSHGAVFRPLVVGSIPSCD